MACINNNDCYVATGGTQSWRFDGQTFEVTNVDPEKDRTSWRWFVTRWAQ